MIVHKLNDLGNEIKQGTADWFQLRLGKPTASEFHRVMTNETLQYSKAAYEYIAELLAEKLLDAPLKPFDPSSRWDVDVPGRAFTDYTQRGQILEREAYSFYEFFREVELERVAFVELDDHSAGGSPDALVGKDGIVEIKCLAPKGQVGRALKLDPIAKKTQVQGLLYICERDWCDVVSYSVHPKIPTLVERQYRNDLFIKALRDCLEQFGRDFAKAEKHLEMISENGVWVEDGGLRAQLLASLALGSKLPKDALTFDEVEALDADLKLARLNGCIDEADEQRIRQDVLAGKWGEVRAMWDWMRKVTRRAE